MEIKATLTVLRDHFDWVSHNGSESQHLYFEDSAICCRSPFYSCASSRCLLMKFVPEQFRCAAAPCRHIPLTENGETLDVLYRTHTREDIDLALRLWLSSIIGTRESLTSTEKTPHSDEAA